MELCRASNIFATHKGQKSARLGYVKNFGWEWKVLLMKTKCVSKLFISRVFTSDSPCPKLPTTYVRKCTVKTMVYDSASHYVGVNLQK